MERNIQSKQGVFVFLIVTPSVTLPRATSLGDGGYYGSLREGAPAAGGWRSGVKPANLRGKEQAERATCIPYRLLPSRLRRATSLGDGGYYGSLREGAPAAGGWRSAAKRDFLLCGKYSCGAAIGNIAAPLAASALLLVQVLVNAARDKLP